MEHESRVTETADGEWTWSCACGEYGDYYETPGPAESDADEHARNAA